ncbi:MAG: hypothetical protein ABI977_06290 [Acidobacteriota bacterium]
MNQYQQTWDELRPLLRKALQQLPSDLKEHLYTAPNGTLSGTLQEFEEFLEYDEFELAWDTLFAIAERIGASYEFWASLANAAVLMGLPEKETQASMNALKSQSRTP